MKQDEVIEMAREIAGQYSKAERFQTWTHDYMMQRLMELVAAEREACAKICEDQQIRSAEASEKAKRVTDSKLYHHCSVTAGWNAAAIRARGEPTLRGEA